MCGRTHWAGHCSPASAASSTSGRPRRGTAVAEQVERRIPTVIADAVDILYRVHGTGAGRGSATAALNRMLRPKKAEKAAGVRRVHAVKKVSFVAYKGEAI